MTVELVLLSRVRYGSLEITGSRLQGLLALLAEDLHAPRALAAIDKWVAAQQDPRPDAVLDPDAPDLIRRTADALLGVRL